MDISYGDWQPGHLRLGAPELFVLWHGTRAEPSTVFKLALHALLGRNILAVDTLQHGSGHTTTQTVLLLPGALQTPDLEQSLQSVMDAYTSLATEPSAGQPPGVVLQDLARALRERHGGELGQWVTDDVLATLVKRGFYTEEHTKRLGLWNATSYEPTPDGKAAQVLVEASVKRASDEFPSWAAHDRARAAAFLAVAGSGVLLMPELYPAIEQLYTASPSAKKLMAAGRETVSRIAEYDFDIFRLIEANKARKLLDLNIEYGRLAHTRPSAE